MKLKGGRTRDEIQHENLRNQIKAIARKQMAEDGTTSIGLRSIAREMSMTAPAIYHYFPKLDDLITALILDAFNGLGEAVEAADASQLPDDYYARLIAVLRAYREWALTNPTDFQLIYGNPIPGYKAPGEITIPAASRPFNVVMRILREALQKGQVTPPSEYQHLPSTISAYLPEMIAQQGYDVPASIAYIGVVGWTRIHGIVMLELFNHIQPVIGSTGEFYEFEIRHLCKSMGLNPKA